MCICHGYLKTNKYVIGCINKQSIDELMNTDEIRFWKRRSTIYNDECLNCEAIYTCGGGTSSCNTTCKGCKDKNENIKSVKNVYAK